MTAVQRQWLQFTGLLIVGLLLLWLALKGQDLTAIGAEMARARWEWIGLGLLLTLGNAALASAGSWRGLSERYDAPGESDAAGGRGERVLRTWDRLDRGDDPTLDETAP